MTSEKYAEIAQAAMAFQLDRRLSPQHRSIARSLYDLASQLTDPKYGCPAETHAVMEMYQHLLNASLRPH
ncbi:MAG: hypothetical protein WAZ34_02780 [Rhodocyclaceae bacterium]